MRIPDRAVVSHIGVLAWICLALAPGASPAYTLDTATVTHTDGQVVLEVSADETIRYDVFQMTAPDRVVVDLLDAETPLEPLTTGDDATAFCGAIRQSLWRDEPDGRVVRYVLETSGPAQWGVTAGGNRLKLCVSRSEDGSALQDPHLDNAIGALAMSTVPENAGAIETTLHGMTDTAGGRRPARPQPIPPTTHMRRRPRRRVANRPTRQRTERRRMRSIQGSTRPLRSERWTLPSRRWPSPRSPNPNPNLRGRPR